MRSLARAPARIDQPAFSSPSRESTGTRTLSKKMLQNFCPYIASIVWTVMPGLFMGTMNRLMPACLSFGSGWVRAANNMCEARWPSVVQIFCPFTMYASPSRTARVRRLARSEPDSGLALAEATGHRAGAQSWQQRVLQFLRAMRDELPVP